MQAGTLTAIRLSEWPVSHSQVPHGAVYRHYWAPSQDGEAGYWWVVSPVMDVARLSAEHTVTEHEDGTISVYPSLVFDKPGMSGFHGYLNRGEWAWGEFEDKRYGSALDEGAAE